MKVKDDRLIDGKYRRMPNLETFVDGMHTFIPFFMCHKHRIIFFEERITEHPKCPLCIQKNGKKKPEQNWAYDPNCFDGWNGV